MRIKAVQIFPGTPLGTYYRRILWQWESAQWDLYLADRGFDDEDEFATYATPDQHEYMIIQDGIPVAWFGVENHWAEGEQLHFSCPIGGTSRHLVMYLRALVRFAKDRGARLFATWDDDPKFDHARKLARLIGVTDVSTERDTQPQAA